MKPWSEHITNEEAIKTIEDYPCQDDFINRHLSQWLQMGEYCDNSIEMASLWTYCKQVYNNHQNQER
jgi:hypothetical protein